LASARAIYAAGAEIGVSESQEQRIARQEAYWTAPKLFACGIAFLAACVVAIYAMASISFALASG
jgi:hypothetical protein